MQYEYTECCGQKHVRFCRLAEYENDPSYSCFICGRAVQRVISAPRFLNNTKEFKAFRSPVDGTIVSSEQGLRNHNARNNVVNVHDGYDEKSIIGATKRNYQKELDVERSKDLSQDLKQAIHKVSDGYVPQPAQQGEL
jgi:hypothetical protein